MPRLHRTIKTDIFKQKLGVRVSREARYLFIGLILRSDDYGRSEAPTALIKAEVYPYDDDVTIAMIDGWLKELYDIDTIRFYEVNNRRYLELPGWTEHQRVQHPAKTAQMPAPASADRVAPEFGQEILDLETQDPSSNGSSADSAGQSQKPESLMRVSGESHETLTHPHESLMRTGSSRGHVRATADVDLQDLKPTSTAKTTTTTTSKSKSTSTPKRSLRDLVDTAEKPHETLVADGAWDDPDEPSEPTKFDPSQSSEDVRRLCALLADRVGRPMTEDGGPDSKGWHDACRRLLEIGPIGAKPPHPASVEQIEYAIEWVSRHPFWHTNILSMTKLRKQWAKIAKSIESEQNGKGKGSQRDLERIERTRRRMGGELPVIEGAAR